MPAAIAFRYYEDQAKADAGRVLALANYQTGKHAEALKVILVVDRIRPGNIYILFQKVEIQLALKDCKNSGNTAVAIMALNPRDTNALESLWRAYSESPLPAEFHKVL